MTRTIWRRAHQVRLPAADAYERVHVELFTAFQRDQRLEDLPDEIAAELDRAFHVDLS